MRFSIATIGVVGLGLTVALATAQGPASTSGRQRSARLMPPIAVHGPDQAVVVRAAAEELPTQPQMTPVSRTAAATSPAWLNGVDPNVRPVSGIAGAKNGGHSPMSGAKSEPSAFSKGIDKLSRTFGNGRPDTPETKPGNLPPGLATAQSPFRGSTAAGAPVYAGPPAYRWYGWGSVTPGANPYAPTGQYLPASANWHSITGTTPGAFPVAVTNPSRVGPGTEPPAYNTFPQNRPIHPVGHPSIPAAGMPEGSSSMPQPVDLAYPPVVPEVRTTPTPQMMAPPALRTPVVQPMQPIEIEPPISQRPAVTPLPPLPPLTVVEPSVSQKELPTPLPVSVTEEKRNWQPNMETSAPDGWGPAGVKSPQPAESQPSGMGLKPSTVLVARGQLGDSQADTTVDLIRRHCAGRARAVEITWIDSRNLTVSFVTATASEAEKLMSEISARPELAPLGIQFRATVK